MFLYVKRITKIYNFERKLDCFTPYFRKERGVQFIEWKEPLPPTCNSTPHTHRSFYYAITLRKIILGETYALQILCAIIVIWRVTSHHISTQICLCVCCLCVRMGNVYMCAQARVCGTAYAWHLHYLHRLARVCKTWPAHMKKWNVKGKMLHDMFITLPPSSVYYLGMVQWCKRSPSTDVSRIRFPDPASYVGWVCWFSTLLCEVIL